MNDDFNADMSSEGPGTSPVVLATDLSLSGDFLDAADALSLNVPQLSEGHLRTVVRQELGRRWRIEHAAFIEAHNATVEAEGLPLAAWKTF